MLILAGAGPALQADRSHPIDCLPDRVVAWAPVAANPAALFGAAFLPGVVLGPPGDSVPFQGSLSVAALGAGGSAVLGWDDIVIEDLPGDDLIVFENPFFRLPLPTSAMDEYRLFVEPARIAISADGQAWIEFPHDADALAAASGVPDVDAALWAQLAGLAGRTPSFTGAWNLPNVDDEFDVDGQGGVSGAGGDAFDLQEAGSTEARFVRVTDAESGNGFAGSGEGFDLDAVVVLHGRPHPPTTTDSDGDRLSDLEETLLYGTDPDVADTDGDGVDDGREVAGCRDPNSFSELPFHFSEPRLWAIGATCTELRWSFVGSGRSYELIRGDLDELFLSGIAVDLGETRCLSGDSTGLRWYCDSDQPEPGRGFFYLVRADGGGFGRSASLRTRESAEACP